MQFYTNVSILKNDVYYRGVDENGKRVQKKIPYQPHLFIPVKEKTKFKTLDGRYVEKIRQETIYEAKDFIQKYKDVEGFDIFGNETFIYQFLGDMYPNNINWNKDKIVIWALDIEVASERGFPDPADASEEVQCITVADKSGYKMVFGLGEFKTEDKTIEYIQCKNERELLERFLEFWIELKPDVVTGWNTSLFDIPYLYRRIAYLFSEPKARQLSPWGYVQEKSVMKYGKKNFAYNLLGISSLDYLDLYKKFTYTSQEKYTLGHISYVEGVGEKINYSEYDNLHTLYKENFQKFIEYNIKDVELVMQLEEKMGLIDLALTLAYDAKVNYQDVFSQVRMWDTLIYNHLRKKHLVMPPKENQHKFDAYAGAYVKEPVTGFHDWVVSFDLNSLYPHLIMQYNISPETLINENRPDIDGKIDVDNLLEQKINLDSLKEIDMTITPNDQFFTTKKQGFLPEMMERMYTDRVRYKTEMIEAEKDLERKRKEKPESNHREIINRISRYRNLQMAKKIQLNSAYGALGNQWFRFYDVRQAEAVTLSGQLAIRWIEKELNAKFNLIHKTKDESYVIASDTDSVYIRLGELVKIIGIENESKEKIINCLDEICSKTVEDWIKSSYRELANYTNAYQQKMDMAREVIADKGIWTAKKRYILNVHDSEGVRYTEPKLKIMGIEAVKSSTPSACRDKIKEALKIIMTENQDTLIQFVNDFKEQFKTLPPEEISFPRSINGLSKYTSSFELIKKGTPIHVRGAILYNKLLKDNNLLNRYPSIQEGEKIKFMYMKEPNPLRNNIVSFASSFPKEFELNNFIDYDLQFEKSFLEPLKIISEKISWKLEETASLEEFFG